MTVATVAESLRAGLAAIRTGNDNEARIAFQATLAQDPVNETALLWMGYLAEDPQVGLDYITQALERHPQSPRAYEALQWAWRRGSGDRDFGNIDHAPPSPAWTPPAVPAAAQFTPSIWQNVWRAARRAPALVASLLLIAVIGWLVGFPLMERTSSVEAWASAFTGVEPSPAPTGPLSTPMERQASAPAAPTPTDLLPTVFIPDEVSSTVVSALPLTPTLTPTSAPPAAPPVTPTSAPPSFVVPEPFPIPAPRQYVPSTTLLYPEPVMPVPVSSDAINIVVLGSDQRPDWSDWHTDVIQIVSIQRDSGAVSVISVPRDLYVYIPGKWMSRINFADYYGDAYEYEGGGPALVRDTILYNLGVRIDYYVRTNFDGLIDIVDTIDGVDIPVHCYLSDYWPYPDENGEYPILEMAPGIHHMDGETALWYARSRKTTSVFSRERRQQQVLLAIWREAREAGMLTRVPALWKQSQDMIQTDLTFVQIMDLARLAFSLDDRSVRFYNIGAEQVTPWRTPYGGAVFLPQWEQIEPLIAEAMAPPPEARLHRTYMPIEVWNGTTNEGWGWLAVDRLYRVGFPAEIGEADRHDYAQTQLIVYSRQRKGSGIEYLKETFAISDRQVIYQPQISSKFGFRLIIGADYQTCPYAD